MRNGIRNSILADTTDRLSEYTDAGLHLSNVLHTRRVLDVPVPSAPPRAPEAGRQRACGLGHGQRKLPAVEVPPLRPHPGADHPDSRDRHERRRLRPGFRGPLLRLSGHKPQDVLVAGTGVHSAHEHAASRRYRIGEAAGCHGVHAAGRLVEDKHGARRMKPRAEAKRVYGL